MLCKECYDKDDALFAHWQLDGAFRRHLLECGHYIFEVEEVRHSISSSDSYSGWREQPDKWRHGLDAEEVDHSYHGYMEE